MHLLRPVHAFCYALRLSTDLVLPDVMGNVQRVCIVLLSCATFHLLLQIGPDRQRFFLANLRYDGSVFN